MCVLAGCRIHIHAACFLAGAVVTQGLPELPAFWYFIPIPPLIAFSVRLRWLSPLVYLSLGCAWTVCRADLLLTQSLPAELERKDVQVDGVVSSLVQRNERYLKFNVDVELLRYLGHTYPSPKRIALRWYQSDRDVRIGQAWRFRVRLKRPHGFQNPGGFDYEQWLFRHGIRATGYVLQGAHIAADNAFTWWRVFRERVQQHLNRSSLSQQSLLRALAVGDRSSVRREQWEILQRTGTVHLLAISGLHIGLVSGFCYVIGLCIARPLGIVNLWLPAPKVGAILAMVGGGVYALMAGFTVPTQRAMVMVVTVMLALLLDRSVDLARSLAIALLVVLCIDPLSVLDIGFWLSFSALISIVLALKLTAVINSKLARMLFIQLALTITLAPLVLFFFSKVSLSSPLANMIAIPIVAFVVVPLVLCGSLALGMDEVTFADTLYGLANYVLDGLWRALTALAAPDWVVWFHSPPLGVAVLALVGLLWQLFSQPWYTRCLGLLCVLPMTVNLPVLVRNEIEHGEFSVSVLDVGQGLSVVVRTSERTLLYDTGARFSPEFDAGTAVVLPYLRHQHVKRIHTLIISHGDNDHIGGMQSVIAELDVARRLSSVRYRVPGAEPCISGQRWRWDGVLFSVLSPEKRDPEPHNNASCVLMIEGHFGRFLLTGDIERQVEALLVKRYGKSLAADGLLVPHQGSQTSSSVPFIEAVSPTLAVVSAGYLNKYGHPAESVTKRYQNRNVALLNTARDGAITIYVTRAGTYAERYRLRHKRYWFGT